jgi:hypothetical protein
MSGSDVLRSILSAFDLAELSDAVYQTYLTTGVSDPDYLLLTVEPTYEFQQRFPGIRDEAGQLIMRPADYVNYERGLRAQFAQYGLPPPTRAQIGNIVQSRRSVDEVAQDLAAYDELRSNPYVRHQFYAYSGVDPGDEGMFALALGLAPDLERIYENALNTGVNQAEYQTRLAQVSPTTTPATAVTAPLAQAFGGTVTTPITEAVAPTPLAPGEIGPPPINIYGGPAVARMDRLRALRKAELANQALFKAGGESATTAVRPRAEAF